MRCKHRGLWILNYSLIFHSSSLQLLFMLNNNPRQMLFCIQYFVEIWGIVSMWVLILRYLAALQINSYGSNVIIFPLINPLNNAHFLKNLYWFLLTLQTMNLLPHSIYYALRKFLPLSAFYCNTQHFNLHVTRNWYASLCVRCVCRPTNYFHIHIINVSDLKSLPSSCCGSFWHWKWLFMILFVQVLSVIWAQAMNRGTVCCCCLYHMSIYGSM